MELAQRHVVITGGAGGIGRALARRIDAAGARAVVIADRELAAAGRIAEEIGGTAVELDAGSEASVRALIERASAAHGPIDVFISNAGVPGAMGGPEADDASFDEAWRVNVMAHVWAARAPPSPAAARGPPTRVPSRSPATLRRTTHPPPRARPSRRAPPHWR